VGTKTPGHAQAPGDPRLLDDLTRQRLLKLGYGDDEPVPLNVLAQLLPSPDETSEGAEPARSPIIEDDYGKAWRSYAEATLACQGLSDAVRRLHRCADARTRLATAFEFAGTLMLEAKPPIGVWAEEDASTELAEQFAGLAALDGGDDYDVEMNLYLPLVAAARSGVGLGRVLAMGASRNVVENRLLLIIRFYLSERSAAGWDTDFLLDLVQGTAIESLHRNL
jgi:hypothetical protein